MVPTKVIGRYEVLEELGHGAMGCVFKAHDPAMGRTVALKTILAAALEGGKGEEYRTRFYREARAAGKLAHPGIVPVFDVGEHEGTPFLVMEYVEGHTLSASAWKGERFTLDRSCEVGQQIAEALGYAHRQGVIHRDIKPANILMTSPEIYGSERARITDFGVAKLAAEEMTSTGQLLGTPAFMPPEQFTGAQVDGRADLFSLGVILYGLVTGEKPFAGETMTAVSYKIVHTEPVPPRKLNPSIPQRLDEAILRCLAKSPADRFQTGEELAQELAALRGVSASGISATGVSATSTDLRRAVTVQTVSGTDDTIDGSAAATAVKRPWDTPVDVGSPAAASQATSATAGRGRRLAPLVSIGVVVAAALIAGGWFIMHRSHQAPAPAPTAAASTSAPAPAVASPADQGTSSPAQAIEAPAPVAKPVARADATPPRQHAAAPVAAPVAAPAINPRTLDPKTNARLKINLDHFPDGVPFTIELNHKPYLNGNSNDKSSFDNVYVPPGVQELRVVLRAGGQRKVSNIVSDDFKAKKHKTLKIQLQGPKGAPGPDTQVFVTLK
jgi:serine/threonine-protein kinase